MTNPLFLYDPHAERAGAPVVGQTLTMPAEVRNHAIRVMRLREGDALQLSDGRGLRARATVTRAQVGEVRITAVDRDPRPAVELVLAQALTKGGGDELAIDVATQLGVNAVIPWQAERSIARWRPDRSGRRWHRTLAAAVEQSRRSWTPKLEPVATGVRLAERCHTACAAGGLFLALHQDARRGWSDVERLAAAVASRCEGDGIHREIIVAVGPEGGITPGELAALVRGGARSCTLGSAILRASVAGPVALTLLARGIGRFA